MFPRCSRYQLCSGSCSAVAYTVDAAMMKSTGDAVPVLFPVESHHCGFRELLFELSLADCQSTVLSRKRDLDCTAAEQQPSLQVRPCPVRESTVEDKLSAVSANATNPGCQPPHTSRSTVCSHTPPSTSTLQLLSNQRPTSFCATLRLERF